MTTRAETIANHLNAAGEHLKVAAVCVGNTKAASIDAAMRCLHLAFLEALGGAECASPAPAAEGGLRAYKPECDSGDCILPMGHAEDHWDGHGAWPRVSPAAEGPWVVRVLDRDADADKTKTRWDAGGGGLSADRTNAVRYAERASAVGAATWFERAGYITTVLPLAEAERAEKDGPLRTSYPHGAVVAPKPDATEDISATLRREEAERKAARQAKPAGWVVRARHPEHGVVYVVSADGGTNYCGPTKAHVFGTEADAQASAHVRTWVGKWTRTVLPVDAAGNVIEGGVAWEAARSYEEAERLRLQCREAAEALAVMTAARDTIRCERDRLRADLDAARAERDTAKAERDKLTTDEADLRYALRTIASLVGGAVALGASTEMHCKVADEVRPVVERLKREEALAREGERIAVAERDRLAAEVQRGREQKPVRWALCSAVGDIEGIWFHESDARALAGTRGGWTIAPLYLAPVVRDHSEVIAQCEEALHRPRTGYECERDSALRAALAALRGAP